MSQDLVKLSMPRCLGLSYPETIDVPNSPGFSELISWWKEAKEQDRAKIAKVAFDEKRSIIDVFIAKKTLKKDGE